MLSEPPGATVRLDNEVVGVTPLDFEFDYFGGRRLTLYKDGYRGSSRLVELEPPWYATVPTDLFTELLLPVGYRFVHVERFELEPETGRVSLPDLQEALQRAEQLRRGGLTGPRPELLSPEEALPVQGPPPPPILDGPPDAPSEGPRPGVPDPEPAQPPDGRAPHERTPGARP